MLREMLTKSLAQNKETQKAPQVKASVSREEITRNF